MKKLFPFSFRRFSSYVARRLRDRSRRQDGFSLRRVRRGVRHRLVVACVIGDGEADTGRWPCWLPQVPQPSATGACRPASDVLDQHPCASSLDPKSSTSSARCAGTAYVEGDDPKTAELMAPSTLSSRAPLQRRRGRWRPRTVADDRVALLERLAARSWTARSRAFGPRAVARRRAAPAVDSRRWCALQPPSCSIRPGGCCRPDCARPRGQRRMGAYPHTNGGVLLRDLRMPDYRTHAVPWPHRARWTPRTPACWAVSCVTSSPE